MRHDYDKLKRFGSQVMVNAGLEAEEADLLMENLLYADSRGVGSHGISRLINYSMRVKSGVITPGANVKIINDAPSALALDGCNGIGAKIGRQAIDLCIARAKDTGCCTATVKNGNHFGVGAFYTDYAAKQGMIAFVVSNSEAVVAPTGGSKPMLGTNPLSIAVPAKRNNSFNLDMATSLVARGKVVLAQKEGHSIPHGWAIDKNGVDTTDPAAVLDGGCMLPFGGAKGYGISLFIDLMCSGLGGAMNCRNTSHFWTDFEHPQNIGYFMIVIDPAKFLPVDTFLNRVDDILDEFKACPPAPGVERVFVPGEIEASREKCSGEQGIELPDAVVREMYEVGKTYGVAAEF